MSSHQIKVGLKLAYHDSASRDCWLFTYHHHRVTHELHTGPFIPKTVSYIFLIDFFTLDKRVDKYPIT